MRMGLGPVSVLLPHPAGPRYKQNTASTPVTKIARLPMKISTREKFCRKYRRPKPSVCGGYFTGNDVDHQPYCAGPSSPQALAFPPDLGKIYYPPGRELLNGDLRWHPRKVQWPRTFETARSSRTL